MSQISPPLRIALGGALLFLVVWMVALRPGGDSGEDAVPAAPNTQTAAPAESAPGQVVEQAQGAATDAETAAVARAGEAAPTTGNTPDVAAAQAGGAQAPGTAGAKPSDVKDAALPKSVLEAIADRKVLVLLFVNPRAADDRAVRREVRALPSRKGKVFKHVANIKAVARYAAVTRGVNLAQSPTTIVVDRKLAATPITGFADRAEIDQIVSDALRVKK